ncbi:hypothetical protein LARV_00614 [Longilinea arvoryzae]|uniref:Uncharacterized protein n=1 Tax=Longilinea arvoryzae TaxID=360412 RepID=A0A0S7BHC5_9CHLR|nr:hypothetical protein [Longilinea arvoryzae]GAP12874.1 hypothetical protein LARV_00614 [Longilinea arvoryzae]
MRITRETLLKTARDTAAQRARASRDILCIYLTGSLTTEQPLLGGATDIDLIIVHSNQPAIEREVVRLTDEVSLDIAHYSQHLYQRPRLLRTDAWIGSFLAEDPLQLYDVAHWFEFTQASAAAQFNEPENVIQRARPLAESARQGWLALEGAAETPQTLRAYLKVIEQAGNAVACLSGSPLTERRFMLNLPERASAIGRPGLADGLADLFTPSEPLDAGRWTELNAAWQSTLTAAAALPEAPARLHTARRLYYERAVDALREDQPAAALWILLRTWTLAVLAGAPDAGWKDACRALELDEAHFERRLAGLDGYLDGVEEAQDEYIRANGI